jgi:hypothetical protein
MTDRLRDLLLQEAETLDVPPSTPAEVLRRGRSVRRRHHAANAVAALAVVGVVAGTTVVATHDSGARGGERPADRVDERRADAGATFSVGTTLFYDDATRTAAIPDAAVKSLYYTSAGVLVRHGDNNWSDGGGEQRFSLVAPDGEVSTLDLVTEEIAHTTDPAQPYLAWGEVVDGTLTTVVHDVVTDEEVARWPVPDVEGARFVTSQLAGEMLFLRVLTEDDASFFEMEWRTGEFAPLDEEVSDIGGGRAVVGRSVIDLATGDTLWTATASDDADLYGPRTTYRTAAVDGDVAPVRLAEPASQYAWTAGGELYSVAPDAVATCDPLTAACEDRSVDLGVGEQEFAETVRLGGATYES